MRKLIAALGVFAFTATAALAVSFTSPGPGTPARKAVLDAMRPNIERTLGARVEFVVEEIRVGGGWAFVRANPQRKDGGALRNPNEEADGTHTEAVCASRAGAGWCRRCTSARPTSGSSPGATAPRRACWASGAPSLPLR